MAYSASEPVADAVYAALQTTAMDAALPGGWHGDVPANPTYPFGWIEIFRETDRRGLGTGEIPEIDLRLHVFSQAESMAEAQEAMRVAISLLKDQALTVSGYNFCGHTFFRETVRLPDEYLQGHKVHEVVGLFNLFVEVAA